MANIKYKTLTLEQSLFIAAGGIGAGYVLFSLAHAMSDKLQSIQLACGAQSLFTGSQSSDCFWGTNILPAYQLVFVVGIVVTGLGLLVGGAASFDAYTKYAEINRLDQEIAEDPQNPEKYIKRANVWRLRKEYTKALADFAMALRIDSHNISAHYDRGLVYIAQSAWEKALADYDIVIEKNPHKAPAYNARGVVLEKLSQPKKALVDYEKAVALEPVVLLYQQNLAKIKAKIDIDSNKHSS